MTSRWKRRGVTTLQWSVTVLAFWYIVRGVSWRRTLSLLSGVDAWVLLIVLVATILEFGTRFSQWWILLNGREPTVFGDAVRIDLVVKFVNHIVPSKASGHSIAPAVVRHYTDSDWSSSVAISGLNTGLYAMLYGLVALCGMALLARSLPIGLAVVIFLSSGFYLVVGLVILLAGRRLDLAGSLFARFGAGVETVPYVGDLLAGIAGKLPSLTDESARLFRSLLARPAIVVPYTLAWAGTLMVFPGIRVATLLVTFGGDFAPLWLLPLVLVIAYSVTVLPLTPGGIGVAEASATLVLVSLGVTEEIALGVVLIDRVLGVYLPALFGIVPMATLDFDSLFSTD